jgi:predicted adenine nucleotide alpha hydrolase (AANH) superfamily ATPase
MGYFYRHNIQPYTECLRRQETLREYADSIGLKIIYQDGYDMQNFIRNVVFREKNRCRYCYYDRLKSTALMAKRGKFDCFSSTLLYSKYQNHELVASTAESVAKSTGVKFYYQDYRTGWKEGIDASRQLRLYRQPYCGCIYSEKERFFKQ